MRIAVLGAGNMGAALIGGVLKGGVVGARSIRATTLSEMRAAHLRSEFGIKAEAGENRQAVEDSDIVILALKPGTVRKVLAEIQPALQPGQILVSLAAALPIASIEAAIGIPMPIFRAMPNIPVLVGEGAIGICQNAAATAAQRAQVESIFRAVGVVCFVEEDGMHAVTALSGSGPAYIYMVIEAMISAGVKMGLSREIATQLSEQTVLGAAKHVRESGLHPAVLRDQVVTPGGTTIVAIHELERHGLRSMIISAIEAATNHSRERARTLLESPKQ